MSFSVDGIRHPVVQGVVAIALGIAVLAGVNWCRARKADARSRAEQRVDSATPIVAAYKDSLEQARRALARSSAGVAHVDTIWRTKPLPRVPATPTKAEVASGAVPLDSLFAVLAAEKARGDTLQARGDTLNAACTRLRNDCDVLAQRAVQLRAAFDSLVAAQRAVIATPAPRRRWGLGCAGGYAAAVKSGAAVVGPGAACGLAFSF
jgi:hypothetical protein